MAQTQDPKQLGLTHLTNFKLEEQNIEQENLPRQAQVSDVYNRRIENYYESKYFMLAHLTAVIFRSRYSVILQRALREQRI